MRDFDDETAMATYIELMNPHFDFIPALKMHRRFAREALEILRRYPAVARLLA